MDKITDKTLIPLSITIALLGGSGYVTYVAFQGNANAQSIERIEKKQELVEAIKIDLEVIKSKLSRIEKKLDDSKE